MTRNRSLVLLNWMMSILAVSAQVASPGDYEADVLHFLSDPRVLFTKNLGERDIRISKVQQKISGCFHSMDGAYTFCLIRSYLSTCRKQDVGAGEALDCLFKGTWPGFIRRAFESRE